jgi:hypothetical protein
MLLRASSKANEKNVGVSCAVGDPIVTDIEHGELLIKFTEFANQHPPEIRNSTEQIITAMGEESFIKASSTVAIFNGLVRSADAMGIPLDDITMSSTIEEREKLGLNDFQGFKYSSVHED